MPEFDIRIVRLPAWAVVLLGALGIALGVALAMLAAGVLLIVFPLVLVLAAIGAVLGRGRLSGRRKDRATVDAIEVDYAVVEEPQSDRNDGPMQKPTAGNHGPIGPPLSRL